MRYTEAFRTATGRVLMIEFNSYLLFYNIVVINRIAAFWAELTWILWIREYVATLVTLEGRCTGRLLLTAFHTEFTLVYGTAFAGPAFSSLWSWLWLTGVSAERALIGSTAFAGPAGRCGSCGCPHGRTGGHSRLLHLLLLHLLHSEHIGNTAAELSDHTHTH